MSKFTFSVTGCSRPIAAETIDLRNANDAALEAARYAGRALSGAPEGFLADDEWMIEVSDPVGLLLLTINIAANRAPAVIRS